MWDANTFFEIINDMVSFEFLLEIKRRLKNYQSKTYLASYLLYIAPIFAHELTKSYKEKTEDVKAFWEEEIEQKVNSIRQSITHHLIGNSKLAKSIRRKMGIDYNNKVYDISIVVRNNSLVDINYESCNFNVEEDFAVWDSLFGIARQIISGLFGNRMRGVSIETFYEILNDQINNIAQKCDCELEGKYYIYSSYKLFANAMELEDADKDLILYRYRVVTAFSKIDSLIPNLEIALGDEFIVSVKNFIRKYKALVIGILGEELKKADSMFIREIKEALQHAIVDSRFWRLNRKVRNNIHYGETHILTIDELAIVDEFQMIYFDVISECFNRKLSVDIDDECLNMTSFVEECNAKGMSSEEILNNYEELYKSYLFRLYVDEKI